MSKDMLIKGIIFITGAAIGSVVTWKLVKTKYEKIANEEIDSMREYYNRKKVPAKLNDTDEDTDSVDTKSIEEIRDMVQELGYKNDVVMKEQAEKEDEEEDEDMYGPEVIAPEESWEQDYPTITLIYYEGDNVLADEKNKIITNIDELVGKDFASHFGEYEDDSVFIRNNRLKVYYEILRDTGTYADYMGNGEW